MLKYQFQQSNIYYPKTTIPKNRLEITDSALLTEIEAELLNTAYTDYTQFITPQTEFDLDFLWVCTTTRLILFTTGQASFVPTI
ncbi:hypothetical protein [Thiomicrorhabdus aquaedulcis]|uniref:hypothetical protein n=1 Tax=Thiomicrorhabdus aquaedulcis TaxID=2211106 RepID=UPI0018D5A784|nr:hypothetical protein [Thiomicrorhabdus aquaedulcis]